MSEQQFDIIFRGDIVFGHQLADVKNKLQQLFKADAAKIDALFTGRPVPLKRGLDQASAQKYKDVLIKAGAQVELVAVGAIQPSDPQPIKPEARSPQSQVAATHTVASASAPLTMAQRLAQQEAEAAQKAELEAAQKAKAEADIKARAAAQSASIAQTTTTAQTATDDQSNWGLAPAGADLLNPTEKHEFVPRDIDTSALSLRASTGNLVDASEQTQVAAAKITVPNYGVAEAGTNLISESEKFDLPLLEIELEDWTIAEAGTDLIAESEKNIQPVKAIHIPEVGLAPVGADLGQLKPQVNAVVPDISGIKLADN